MGATNTIFKREIGAYFRSPIGWVVAAIMLLVCGFLFQTQALGAGKKMSADVLFQFFVYCSGCVAVAGFILATPLLTGERQQHTIVLLNTSPVRDVEIVLGKYLAGMLFLTFITILSLYMPRLIQEHGKVSTEQLFVGYLGMLLLGSAALAIGLFASALTRHILVGLAVVAGIGISLHFLYFLAAKLDGTLKDVGQSLSLWMPHYQQSFAKGVFSLKDTVYYLAVTYFFLMLATKTLEAKRWQ